MYRKTFPIASFFSLLLLIACQNQGGQTDSPSAEADSTEISTDDVTAEPENDAPEIYEKGGLRIYPKKDLAQFPDAGLKLNSPADGAVSNDGKLAFDFEVSNYQLGQQTEMARMNLANSDKGQHIHLIIDNDPYSAHYEPTFTKDVGPGHHYAIAFLSRSYHESVKNPNAAVVFQFTVGDQGAEMMDLSNPMLFYSRPKGTYSGEGSKKVLFDFYLKNAELASDGYSVITTINDSLEFEFDTWQPYIIEGLPMGENTINIKLVDANGKAVDSKANNITRKFILEE